MTHDNTEPRTCPGCGKLAVLRFGAQCYSRWYCGGCGYTFQTTPQWWDNEAWREANDLPMQDLPKPGEERDHE